MLKHSFIVAHFHKEGKCNMPKAKRLPSGNYRCRVFDHTEVRWKDGIEQKKKIYKSFTAETRRDAERLAAEWTYLNRMDTKGKNVIRAVQEYINAKENVLSPSTVRAYRSMANNAFDLIGHFELSSLTSPIVQKWVNQIARTDTPKTVRNKYALLSATYEMYTGQKLSVTLPAKKRPDLYTPSTEDVKRLVDYLKEKPSRETLLLAVMLSAFCSLRRGEICALTSDDIRDGRIYVSRAMVETAYHSVSIKQPKTYAGYRVVRPPEALLRRLEGIDGRIVPLTPNALTDRFRRAVLACFGGAVHFRLHDLRHYYVSFAHAMGVPDAYIRETGGWKTEHVMRRVYLDTLADEKKKQEEMLIEKMEQVAGV